MADYKKRKRSGEERQPQPHTRTSAACDACRVSKTRCDAARPQCAKCTKRGRECVYPDKDPSSIFEEWGHKIMTAIEDQGKLLSTIAHNPHSDGHSPGPKHPIRFSSLPESDLETMSRKDVPWTPITGSDKILDWAVFPRDRPAHTLPASAYLAKENPYALETMDPTPARIFELRDIFMERIEPKFPLVKLDHLNKHIEAIVQDGFDHSASSCMVLLVFALSAIWGNYPEDERRLVTSDSGQEVYTMAVPEERLREAYTLFAMAQRRMAAASLDSTLLGVSCYCLFGTFFQYTFEPIQGWKMFRTAAMLWETYYSKHSHGAPPLTKEDESLESQLYWTCMKAECEMRYELPDLPICTLQESSFPVSLPNFPERGGAVYDGRNEGSAHPGSPQAESPPTSHFYFLAEISMRRLMNRARHAATSLHPEIGSSAAAGLAETLHELEDQLQQWLECLPPALQFNVPPDSWPETDEPELVKLTRERYVEVRELLCRAFLYICLHAGPRITDSQARMYGAKASYGLRFSIYRIQTEKPFFRHAGSWVGCRARFNQALCLVAAARGKQLGVESCAYLAIPPMWREHVEMARDRLEIWSDQGAGVEELATLLNWLLKRHMEQHDTNR